MLPLKYLLTKILLSSMNPLHFTAGFQNVIDWGCLNQTDGEKPTSEDFLNQKSLQILL